MHVQHSKAAVAFARRSSGFAFGVAEAPLLVAVDGGGSGSRAVLAVDGTVVSRIDGAPLQLTTMDQRAVLAVLDEVLDELMHGVDPRQIAAICLGIAGAGNPERRDVVERWLGARLPEAEGTVCRDVDLVLAAGSPDQTGIAAIAGTGAIVLGRDVDGVERVADGRGPLAGDRGGGFRLGLDAIRLVVESRSAPQPLTAALCETLGVAEPELAAVGLTGTDGTGFVQIAAIGGQVCRLAAEGDAHSQRLVTEAAKQLAASYRAVWHALRGAKRLPHLLAGGLASTTAYRAAFTSAARRADWQLVAEPVLGGLTIAASLEPTQLIRSRTAGE
jgi:N-acetylglucosamine kinase-like BadF-type ATPase